MSENPSKRERGFWDVFLKSDNKRVLLVIIGLVFVAILQYTGDDYGDSGWWILAGVAGVLLITDVVIIYNQTIGFFKKEDK